MPDLIQAAPSGRAKCRGCAASIAKGELRFGESLPNAYGEGEALSWFHLRCAAAMRPDKLLPVLETAEAIPDGDALRRVAEQGLAFPRLTRLVRAERAPSGRAHCRSCRELIEKGAWRLSLQLFEDGRFTPIGSIHLACAESYFGTANVLQRLLDATPTFSAAERAELEDGLQHQRPSSTIDPQNVEESELEPGSPQAGQQQQGAESATRNAPDLAKTRAPELEAPDRLKRQNR